jgi:hypothetical protein
MTYRPYPGDPSVDQPTVTVEPKTWSVVADGEVIGRVCFMPSTYSSDYWLALHGDSSKDIGRFDSKDDAVAAMLAYKVPEHCPTCGQVVK